MLETLAIVLIILWILGLVSTYTLGGFIHILLVIAVVLLILRVIRGGAFNIDKHLCPKQPTLNIRIQTLATSSTTSCSQAQTTAFGTCDTGGH